jgi:hypothetical protein
MRFLNQVGLSLLLLIASPVLAHHAKFIDITNTTQRLELRYLTESCWKRLWRRICNWGNSQPMCQVARCH